MKKLMLITILIGAIAFAGCSLFRQGALQATDEYVAGVHTQMQVVQKALSVWPFESGKINKFCGEKACSIDRYGPKAISALEDLDRIAAIAEEDRTQEDLGIAFTSFGIILRVMGEEIFEELAPRIFELIGKYF